VPIMVQSHGLGARTARRLLADWLINGMVVAELFDSDSKAKGLKVVRWPG
jgi:hypothetical protein